MRFLASSFAFAIALVFTTPIATANQAQNLPIHIAAGIMQFVEWESHPASPHSHTLCVLENKTRDWTSFQKNNVVIKSLDNLQKIKYLCDVVLIEKELTYLIAAISLTDGPKATIIIGISNRSPINDTHFSIIKDIESYKIVGNAQKLNSQKFTVSSKLLKLLKSDSQ